MRNPFRRLASSADSGPGYPHVRSRQDAERLEAAGELARLLLLPAAFGGTEDPRNIVWVPPFVVELKNRTDLDTILPLIEDGTVSSYEAIPSYDGNSFVPTSIDIHASDPGSLRVRLAIWGHGLQG